MKISRTCSLKEIMVLKSKLLPYLTCPICSGIFRVATTISECLHTFCEKCITKKLIEDDCCPICGVPLGCTPLEKLRTDHQLNEVKRLLLFRKKNPKSATAPPAKRKEKFLSSLIPPSCPPTVGQQINKFSTGKHSTSNNGLQKRATRDPRPATRASDKKSLSQAKNFNSSILNAYSKTSERSFKFSTIYGGSKKAECMEVSRNVSEEPAVLDTVLRKCPNPDHPPRRLLRKTHRVASQHFKEFSHVAEDFCRILTATSSDASTSKEIGRVDSPETCSRREEPIRKFRFRDHAARKLNTHIVERNEMQIEQNLDKSHLTNKRSSVSLGKQNSRKNLKIDGLTRSASALCATPITAKEDNRLITTPEHRGSGFWFHLQAAKNQDMNNAFPQISTQYIRIWDGRQPVSAIKKYLAKKLNLKSEKEVEITCQGQPVVPGLPLESVKNIWLATALAQFLPDKEASTADSCSSGSDVVRTRVQDDLLIVLTYGRKLSN